MTLTPDDLDRLDGLLREATPGPWVTSCAFKEVAGNVLWLVGTSTTITATAHGDYNAHLIAALRNHAGELVRLARAGLYLEEREPLWELNRKTEEFEGRLMDMGL